VTTILRLLTLLLCLAPAIAMAEPKPDEAARSHYENGKRLATAGKYAEAYSEFEAGYSATPRPAFLFNMAEAARGMGDVPKARAAYERFLAAEPSGAVADTARRRLAELPASPPRGAMTSAPSADTKSQPAAIAPGPGAPTPAEAAKMHESLTATGPMPLPAQAPADRPLWKKWPFWAAVGGAIATTVVIVAVSTSRGGPSCGAGCIDLR
jgi:tetratricopeptide (TPR) repeat protein